MGGDADGQEGGAQPIVVDGGREGGAQDDVAQVPEGVGRVEEGEVVAPRAQVQGVEGGAIILARPGNRRPLAAKGLHESLVPHMMMAPPRDKRLAFTSGKPHSRQRSRMRSSGHRWEKSRM